MREKRIPRSPHSPPPLLLIFSTRLQFRSHRWRAFWETSATQTTLLPDEDKHFIVALQFCIVDLDDVA